MHSSICIYSLCGIAIDTFHPCRMRACSLAALALTFCPRYFVHIVYITLTVEGHLISSAFQCFAVEMGGM